MESVLTFLSKNFGNILKLCFGIFILYYLIFFLTPRIKISTEYKTQLDSLNIIIKKLHTNNLLLEKKIDSFDLQIEEVDSNINTIKRQKTIVKEIYHEKISNVDKLSIPEIDSFFTNRYK